jgi:hypothetical protein
MKVVMTTICTFEDDGFQETTTYEKDNVQDLHELLYAMSNFLRATGFSYHDSLIAVDNDGNERREGF